MLLEPIMKLEISTPDDYVGDIVSNLQQRRGLVTNTEVREHLTIIEADVPTPWDIFFAVSPFSFLAYVVLSISS